jgi:hypothetical protein
MPIEQGQDALPLGFGGRAQETEVADALQAPWQDVLEETVQEAFGRQAEALRDATLTVPVGEGNAASIVRANPLGAEGGAIDVSGQILEGRFAGADGLNIYHPIERPGEAGDLEE